MQLFDQPLSLLSLQAFLQSASPEQQDRLRHDLQVLLLGRAASQPD